ncbi:hypothetical protein PsorP6_010869 [Peronosclerospora sorghi]|uniref:Uncharacterized protein n=1 Tax=Peronosclerospora sorghi TaxID=230839 RepID=A0ACC0VXT0_9STRA|nr:hypothetical protein PsorP6_010869 [Peronosclerospora sorghi]
MWKRLGRRLCPPPPHGPRRALTAAAHAQGKVPIHNLFVTSTEVARKTAPVLIGLAHTLEQKFAKVGYFRPIQPRVDDARRGDHHVHVMRSQLGMDETDVRALYGVTSAWALEHWLAGKQDELFETILDRYERMQAGYDFMIIEGSHVAKHESAMSWNINVDIAKALGAPVLTISDFQDTRHTDKDALVDEIVARTALNADQVAAAGLVYIGNIANRVPTTDPHALREALRAKTNDKKLPCLGFVPQDEFLASKRLNEVTHQLGATQLFGTQAIPNSVVVTSGIVATSALNDLFAHLKKYKDGALVITSADRSDILLGLLASRLPGILPNVAAIVLTNGSYPHSNTHEILQGVEALDRTGLSIPIFSVPEDTFTTATNFCHVSTAILPTSHLKIDRSKQLFDAFVEQEHLIGELTDGTVVHRSPKQFQHFLYTKARAVQRHIVLPEGQDIRVLQAADDILRQQLARLTILGEPDDMLRLAKSLNLDLSRAELVRTATSPHLESYVQYYYEKRHDKGVTLVTARDAVLEETCFGTLMVERGHADGMVSGACHTTAHTIRPALQLIKTARNRPLVSSIFFMCLERGVRIYGDCAVNADPSASELAQIAVTSAESAEAFGLLPKVALLSYATGDSNSGPMIDKVRDATRLAQALRPDLDIYGPIQYDAAVDASIAKKKLAATTSHGAKVGGHANVLIFPDLNTGNNTYKAVQQSTGCIAMGPMLQGLRKPVNDLSRGATVKDIVTTVAITAIQADHVSPNTA